jgi:hypothetical protein
LGNFRQRYMIQTSDLNEASLHWQSYIAV